MEQHPVPQDVTGFQFKLIGDMTVTQFVYLAAGTLLAYFLTRAGWPEIFKWPAVGLAFFSGFGLAFMPVEGRPLDRWVVNFFRSCYCATIFVWKKQIIIPDILRANFAVTSVASGSAVANQSNRQNLEEYLKSLPEEQLNHFDQEEKRMLTKIKNDFDSLLGVINITPQTPLESTLTGLDERKAGEDSSLAWTAKLAQGIAFPINGGTRIIPRVGKIQPHPLGPMPLNSLLSDKSQKQILLEVQKPPKPKEEEMETKKIDTEELAKEAQAVHKKIPKEEPKTNEKKDIAPQASPEIENLKKQLGVLQDKQKMVQGEEAEQLQKELEKLENRFAETLSSNKQLQEQLDQIRKQTRAKKTEEVVVPSQTMEMEKKETSTVKFVPSQMAAQVGVPQPTTANIVSGIIKDNSGEILTNILIEVQDKNGNPVRALKTNRLGQFAVATPLENGTYTIHFEDIRNLYQFDIIEVTLDGKIFPAMEVRAKNQQDAEREKLKEALFGKQN